ncbi:hypothetical protein [Actinoplanes sp. NPDC026619]|uniref:hypothetical protein n=1 Tax=Actinoplanes sp. NPDC026619 TaxID=3155798 RepID=UPI0033EA6275
MTPSNVVAVISILDRIMTMLDGPHPVSPRAIDAEAGELERAMRAFSVERGTQLENYHVGNVRLERLRRDEAHARRELERAREPRLQQLRERELRKIQSEIDHLERLHPQLADTRRQVNESAAVLGRGLVELRRLREVLEVENAAAAATRAAGAAYAELSRARQEIEQARQEADHRAAQGRRGIEEAMDDDFVTGLVLGEAEDRRWDGRG